jgi:hypothetical protein
VRLSTQHRNAECEVWARRSGACDFITRLDVGYGVLVADDIAARLSGDDRSRTVTAANIAHRAPVVSSQTGLQELAGLLKRTNAKAAVVCVSKCDEPIGIVTRSALADAFLEWFATRLPESAHTGPLRAIEPSLASNGHSR